MNWAGKVPLEKDRFARVVISLEKTVLHDFSKDVGIKSREHDLEFEDFIKLRTSSVVTGGRS